MRPPALLPLLLVLTACSSEVVERSARRDSTRRLSQGIVNGAPDTAAGDSVVYIDLGSQGSFCTGTFIAPNLVITARHCVAQADDSMECGAFGAPKAPSSFSISVGLQHATTVATGSKVILDDTKANNICGNDIALIQLDREVPNAKLSKVRLTKLTTGEPSTTSGYGDDGTGNVTAGRFVKTGITVDAVGPTPYSYTTLAGEALALSVPSGEIVTGESTCFGDSGGPLFDAAGNVIGMTSRGIDEKCNDRPSIYTDTASHAATISAAATAAGHPLQPANPLPGDATKPGTTPQDDSPRTDGTADDTGDGDSDGDSESDEPTSTPTKKTKKKTGLGSNASAGCAAAPGAPLSSSSSSLPMTGLAIGAVLAGRRRRRDAAR